MAALMYDFFVMKAANATAASPDNANDGKDPSGCNVSAGVYDDLGGTNGDFSLTDAGAFAGISIDDPIYVDDAGSGNITTGLYPVKTVVSDNEVLFYESIGADASDVTSSDGPVADFEVLLTTISALGDRVVIGDGTYTHQSSGTWLSSTVAFDAIGFFGANARGVVDGTQPVLSGASHNAGTSTFNLDAPTNDGWHFHNLRFTAGLLYNIEDGASGVLGVGFYNCRIDNAVNHGMLHMSIEWVFEDTEIDSNGGAGVSTTTSTASDGGATYRRCRIHDNTSHGVQSSRTVTLHDSLFYNNGGSGWFIDRKADGSSVDRCIFYGNTANGIEAGGVILGFAMGSITNSHFVKNDKGLDWGTFTMRFHGPQRISYNWFYLNTTDDIDHPSGGEMALGEAGVDTNTYGIDPLYESETNGAEDFRPQEASPLWAAGIAVAVR